MKYYDWNDDKNGLLKKIRGVSFEQVTQQQGNKEVFRRQKMKRAGYIDKDEMELAQSLETEYWISDLTQKEKNQYEEYARNSLIKQKRINIRMTERDLKKIQAKAIEEGLTHQSLISMLIHKYNEGKVSIKEWQSKGMQPIADKHGSA